jgi:(p)ppGpp synthase/HD superfamily hydrolase
MMNAIIDKARIVAKTAHGAIGQRRKYTGRPYFEHPVAVATIVRRFGGTESMICAALLHDVVEDTGITLDFIRKEFNNTIAGMVSDLTDVSKPEDGNRETRKAIDRAHSAAASAEAQTVKVADLIDNARNLSEHDPDFARVFFREKALLLDVLTKADSIVRDEAWRIVNAYRARDLTNSLNR